MEQTIKKKLGKLSKPKAGSLGHKYSKIKFQKDLKSFKKRRHKSNTKNEIGYRYRFL